MPIVNEDLLPVATRAYLHDHDIVNVLQTMLDEVLYTTPERPYDSLVLRLSQFAQDSPVFSTVKHERCLNLTQESLRIQVVVTVRGVAIVGYDGFISFGQFEGVVESLEAEIKKFPDLVSAVAVGLRGFTALDALRIPAALNNVFQAHALPINYANILQCIFTPMVLKAFAAGWGTSLVALLRQCLLMSNNASDVGAQLRHARDVENMISMGKVHHLVQVVDSTNVSGGDQHSFRLAATLPLDVKTFSDAENLPVEPLLFQSFSLRDSEQMPLANAVTLAHSLLNDIRDHVGNHPASQTGVLHEISLRALIVKARLQGYIDESRSISVSHGILFCNGNELWSHEHGGYTFDGGQTVMTGLQLVDFYVELYTQSDHWIKVLIHPFRTEDLGYVTSLRSKVPQLEIFVDFGNSCEPPSGQCDGFGYVAHCRKPMDMLAQHDAISNLFEKSAGMVCLEGLSPSSDIMLSGLLALPAKYWSLSCDFVDAGGVEVLDAQWREFFSSVVNAAAA